MSLKKIAVGARYFYLAIILIPSLTQAATPTTLENLKIVGTGSGFKENTDFKVATAYIIQALLGFIGMLFFILILWGGAQWMLSGGNEKKIEDAKKRMVSATIGLALVLTSYAIARTITGWLAGAVSSGTPAP